MTIQLAEPVDEATAIVLWVFCCVYTVLAFTAAFILFKNRHSRFVAVRTPALIIFSTCYGPVTQWLTVPSYVFGKNETTCDLISIAYALYLPLFVTPYQLMFPTIVFSDMLNSIKRERNEQGKISWKWKLKKFLNIKFKVLILVISLLFQLAVFLLLRFLVQLPGGEDGQNPPGVYDDCFRNSLVSFASCQLLYYFMGSMLSMRALMVKDPFHVGTELMMMSTYFAPFLIISVTYPYGPQIYPDGFDYRWVPMVSIVGGFLISVVPVAILSFPSAEDWLDRKINSFKTWRQLKDQDDETESNANNAILMNQKVDIFQAVLENPHLLEAFTQYTVKDWSVENVLFYKEVEVFENSFAQSTDAQRNELANRIVSEFVIMGAPLEINIEYNMRMNLVKEVKDGKIREDIFKHAKKHIFELMKKDSFEKWQRSPEYKKAVKDTFGGNSSTGGNSKTGGSKTAQSETHSKLEQRKSALLAQASNSSMFGDVHDAF